MSNPSHKETLQFNSITQTFLNGNFKQSVFWKVKNISMCPNEESNGFILQKIMRSEFFVKQLEPYYSNTYFEAWLIKQGDVFVVSQEKPFSESYIDTICPIGTPHDIWTNYPATCMNSQGDCIDAFPAIPFNKYIGEAGTIEMASNIYWIPYNTTLYDKVNAMPMGLEGVNEAGGLRSSKRIDFEDELPLPFHKYLTHNWCMNTVELICSAICEHFDNIFRISPLEIETKVNLFFSLQNYPCDAYKQATINTLLSRYTK